MFSNLLEVQKAQRSGKFRVAVLAQNEVFGSGHVQNQSALVAVFGNVCYPGLRNLACVGPSNGFALIKNLTAQWGHQASNGLHQLALSVAVNARNPQDFTRSHIKTHVGHGVFSVQSAHTQTLHLERHLSGLCRAFVHPHQHVAAHHHPGDDFVCRALGGNGPNHLTVAQHAHFVRNLENLVQFVRDKNYRVSLLGKLVLEKAEQLLGLTGGQNRCWLVQNQNLCAPVQGF